MIHNKIAFIPLFIFSSLFLCWNCSPSSYTIRYKDFTDIKTYDDSVKVGLIEENLDDQIYYSQVQDSSFYLYEDESDSEVDSSEEVDLDVASLLKNLKNSESSYDSNLMGSSLKEKMLMEMIKYINTPYKFGGNSEDGIDCSAFTQNVFSSCLGTNISRSAREQFTQGYPVRSVDQLIFGDLVFFNTRRAVRPGHVGIYIGDNLFVHASSSKGVIVSSLEHKYYSRKYMGGRRINDFFSNN